VWAYVSHAISKMATCLCVCGSVSSTGNTLAIIFAAHDAMIVCRSPQSQICLLFIYKVVCVPSWNSNELVHLTLSNKAAEGVDDINAFRVTMAKRLLRTREWASCDEKRLNCAIVAWCMQPCDHLWHRIQHVDDIGGSLLEVMDPNTCSFKSALKDLTKFLHDGMEDGSHLQPLFHHFAPELAAPHRDDLACRLRSHIVSMALQIWWRFVYNFSQSWDLELLRMFDKRTSQEDAAKMANRIWEQHECCLNPYFARKVTQGSKWH
jgi:hypothetical protein